MRTVSWCHVRERQKRGKRIVRPDRHRLSGRRRILAETFRQRGNSDVTNNLVAGPKLAQVLRMSKMANMVKLNPGELVKALGRKLGGDKSEQRFQEVLFSIGTLGLASQRRLAAMQTQLDNLSSAIRRLESDYERLFMRSLRSRKARKSSSPSFDTLEEKMTTMADAEASSAGSAEAP
jgi:hypothetical protein